MPQRKRRTTMTTVSRNQNFGLNYDIKVLIVIVLLVFAYPVGLVLMFLWMDWPGWVKALIFLPVILVILAAFMMMGNAPVRMGRW